MTGRDAGIVLIVVACLVAPALAEDAGGAAVLNDLDIHKQAGGRMRTLVEESRNVRPAGASALKLVLTPKAGRPSICGVQIVSQRRQILSNNRRLRDDT